MECENCKKEFKEGEEYLEEPIFGEPVCMNCLDHLRETLKDAEDWSSLSKLDDGDCVIKKFVLKQEGVKDE